MSELEQRIRTLERANRRMRLAAVAASGAVIVAIGLGGTRPGSPAEVVRASRFELVDDKGAVLATLGVSGSGGSLVILDDQGHRLFAAAGAKTPGGEASGVVSVFGAKGRELIQLAGGDTGVGTVRTFDGDGKELVKLATITADGPSKGSGAVVVSDPARTNWPGIFTTRVPERRR